MGKLKKTTLGRLYFNNLFLLDGNTYRVGRLIRKTNGYAACVDVKTKKTTRFHIDTIVEVEVPYEGEENA